MLAGFGRFCKTVTVTLPWTSSLRKQGPYAVSPVVKDAVRRLSRNPTSGGYGPAFAEPDDGVV